MKKIFTYMTLMAAVVLTACSDSDIAQSSAISSEGKVIPVLGTMASVAVFEEGIGDNDAVISKSQLYYDRVQGQLWFVWDKPTYDPGNPEEYKAKVDHIGIFAEGNAETQLDFMLDPEESVQDKGTYVTGAFKSVDEDVNPITGGTRYFSYFPYQSTGSFTYEAVPVSYSGQVQATNEKMGLYLQNKTAPDAAFLESEKAAAAHLGKFDYMISDATATAGSHVHFNYSHVASIVRFYMLCPSAADDNIFYDSLQVYNSQANFTVDATMNLVDKELSSTKTSHVMTLGFHPAIDMTCNNHNSTSSYEQGVSKYWNMDTPTKGYIMAYMMVAPVDLSVLGEKSTLYLIGRKASYYTYTEYKTAKGVDITEEEFDALPKIQKMKIYETYVEYNTAKGYEPGDEGYIADAAAYAALPASDKMKDYARKVYKKEGMSKLNFQAGKHHQWSVSGAAAGDPIEFQNITIQEWENGPGFTNEDGTGTADW